MMCFCIKIPFWKCADSQYMSMVFARVGYRILWGGYGTIVQCADIVAQGKKGDSSGMLISCAKQKKARHCTGPSC